MVAHDGKNGENAGRNDTKSRLLAAAELIVVEKGITGLSVRKVGQKAGLNPALVTYHFGGIAGLLEELCTCNLDPLVAAWADLPGPDADLETLLRSWLAPLLAPAAFTPEGRALVVLDEIASHGDGALGPRVIEQMESFSHRLNAAFAQHCLHLDEIDLRRRLRFIAAAPLGPPPRGHRAPRLADGTTLDGLDELVQFAAAALRS